MVRGSHMKEKLILMFIMCHFWALVLVLLRINDLREIVTSTTLKTVFADDTAVLTTGEIIQTGKNFTMT